LPVSGRFWLTSAIEWGIDRRVNVHAMARCCPCLSPHPCLCLVVCHHRQSLTRYISILVLAMLITAVERPDDFRGQLRVFAVERPSDALKNMFPNRRVAVRYELPAPFADRLDLIGARALLRFILDVAADRVPMVRLKQDAHAERSISCDGSPGRLLGPPELFDKSRTAK
jgi:hypothetical protein